MGKKGGGYNIDTVLRRVNSIFLKEQSQKVILIGLGNIGRALFNYRGFERESISIVAGFDIDPSKCSKSYPCPVFPLEQAKIFIQENAITIAILAVPEISAQRVLNYLVECGIHGVLNFAPCTLQYPLGTVTVNNVNLVQELEQLIYFVNTPKHSITTDTAAEHVSSGVNA
ncbi:MAG: redox-sensing transcriptional repressor Rex [Chitinispirillaceae bacterium]|nr:redox-sensing transcriptional repressor Rex [Chitinispirillaceae bacterium]